MIAFEHAWLLPWVLAAFALACLLTYLRYRSHRRGSYVEYAGIICLLRILALLSASLLVLNPQWVERVPDEESFLVGVLTDVSESMNVRDLKKGASRLEAVSKLLDNTSKNNLYYSLKSQYQLLEKGFVEQLIDLEQIGTQNGTTAVGEALLEFLRKNETGKPALGSVLLISDGISLKGASLREAAERYAKAGVPVSVVGVGREIEQGDLSIAFMQVPLNVRQNEDFSLKLKLTNAFHEAYNFKINLFDGDSLTTSIRMKVSGKSVKEAEIGLTPEYLGHHIYRAEITNAPSKDLAISNNMDLALVEVIEPEKVEVLYLSSQLDPNYRFLTGALKESKFKLTTITRLDKTTFFNNDNTEIEGFPKDELPFLRKSVLILHSSALRELKKEALNGLRHFLNHRGGGMLVWGPLDNLPEDAVELLPVYATKEQYIARREQLLVREKPIFSKMRGGILLTSPALYLPDRARLHQALKTSLGARVVMEKLDQTPVLLVQRYGAGKVAYLATENSWRWALEGERSNKQYSQLWHYLLGWLSGELKEVIETSLAGEIVKPKTKVALDAFVRDDKFEPSLEAQVIVVIKDPKGYQIDTRILIPDPLKTGSYRGDFVFEEVGLYSLEYKVKFKNEKEASKTIYVPALRAGGEGHYVHFHSDVLRQLAKETGGTYHTWPQYPRELPISSKIELVERRASLTYNAPFLFLFLAFMALEWFLRRQQGLK